MDKTLQHVGVLGMRWGHRKNPRISSQDSLTARALKKKKVHELSNDELKKLTTRLNLESQYNALTPSLLKKGKSIVTDTMTEVASTAIKKYLTLYTIKGVNAVVNKILSEIDKRNS
jgi:hypothetical protein